MKKLVIVTLCIILVFFAGCSSSSSASPTEPIETVPSTSLPEEVNEYAVIDKFIELYNAAAENDIAEITLMDIHGDDYQVEFRLNAFKNAVGKKATFPSGSIQIVNYGVWKNENIRVYASADTYASAIEVIYTTIHIFDSTITDEEIAEQLSRSTNLVLGSGGYISGHLSNQPDELNNYGCAIMIDCSKLNFID